MDLRKLCISNQKGGPCAPLSSSASGQSQGKGLLCVPSASEKQASISFFLPLLLLAPFISRASGTLFVATP